MLYFSKLRILFITLFSLLFVLIASSNLFKIDDNFFDKKINLGLDLQGGSYLLLEIDNTPVIEQKLQNLTTTIRNFFKDQNIKLSNIKIENENIFFNVDENNKQLVIDIFTDENSEINPYYPRFKSHQLNIEDLGDNLKVYFSKQGLIKLKTSSQDQAIEIVRRRIDEVGTNEPNILKIFFEIHDPTTLNSQGPDFGTQYRSEIFYLNDNQKKIAEKVLKSVDDKLLNKVVTKISLLKNYCPAEEYHQKYLEKR